MNTRLEEIKRRQAELRGQIVHLEVEIKSLEEERYVQVQFHGHSKRYTYELPDGHEADIGEYVAVFSPHTEQDELVRVVAKGPGAWAQRYSGVRSLKFARQVDWVAR